MHLWEPSECILASSHMVSGLGGGQLSWNLVAITLCLREGPTGLEVCSRSSESADLLSSLPTHYPSYMVDPFSMTIWTLPLYPSASLRCRDIDQVLK